MIGNLIAIGLIIGFLFEIFKLINPLYFSNLNKRVHDDNEILSLKDGLKYTGLFLCDIIYIVAVLTAAITFKFPVCLYAIGLLILSLLSNATKNYGKNIFLMKIDNIISIILIGRLFI